MEADLYDIGTHMGHELTISPLGLKLIKAYEGFRPAATRLVTGQRVIGYGHIVDDNASMPKISREQADLLLQKDLAPIFEFIDDTVHAPLSQSQFDALCALIFNIGPENFLTSNVRQAINNGRILDAAAGFDEWRKAEISGNVYVVDALMRRRTAEKALFLRQEKGMVRASRAQLDVQSDESFQPVSDDAQMFDPDIGIVDMAPYATKPSPARRREDGPLGILTLSEVEPRSIYDPQTRIDEAEDDLDSQALSDAAPELNNGNQGEEDFDPAEFGEDDDFVIPSERVIDKRSELESPQRRPSPIAIAAAEVSDRLDALIDNTRADRAEAALAKPEDSPIDAKVSYKAANSNDEPQSVDDDEAQTPPRKAAQRHSADRYIQRHAGAERLAGGQVKPIKAKNSAAPGVFMFAGGCLLAGGLVSHFTQNSARDDVSGLLVPTAIVLGAVMLLAASYYMLRGARR